MSYSTFIFGFRLSNLLDRQCSNSFNNIFICDHIPKISTNFLSIWSFKQFVANLSASMSSIGGNCSILYRFMNFNIFLSALNQMMEG